MGQYNISDEERKRRSEAAKRLNEQRRGMPRKTKTGSKSANEEVARWARDNSSKMITAIKRCLDSDSPQVVLKAVITLLDTELRVDANKKGKDYDKMDKEQLAKYLGSKLVELESSGAISIQDILKGARDETDSQ